MLERHALALRTNLLVRGLDEAPYASARRTAADAVTFDLAVPALHSSRAQIRRLAATHAAAAAAAGRAVHVRISDARSGELEADAAAVVGPHLAAVLLAGVIEPQDVRDADVAIRKHEMRHGVEPGSVRLIPQVDSAAGLLALQAVLAAVDRHSAVALDADGVAVNLGIVRAGGVLDRPLDHAMWDVAVASRATELPWVLLAPDASAEERARLVARACEFGASGAYVSSEAEVRGLNSLFTPDPETVTAARRVLAAWERLRARGELVGALDNAPVDRRAMWRARMVVAMADAIARRERAARR